MRKLTAFYSLIFAILILTAGVFINAATESASDHYKNALSLQRSGKTEAAVDELEKAVGLDPENAFYLTAFGMANIDIGNIQVAMDSLTKAVALNDKLPEAFSGLGVCYNAKGDYNKSIEFFTKALNSTPEKSPDRAVLHNNIGQNYYLLRQLDKSEEELKKAVELNGKLLTAYINLGNVYTERGDYKGAIEFHKKAVEIAPDYALPRNNLAFAYYKLGDFENAMLEMQKAIQVDPANKQFKENFEFLKSEQEKSKKGTFDEGTLAGLPKEVVLKPRQPQPPQKQTATTPAVAEKPEQTPATPSIAAKPEEPTVVAETPIAPTAPPTAEVKTEIAKPEVAEVKPSSPDTTGTLISEVPKPKPETDVAEKKQPVEPDKPAPVAETVEKPVVAPKQTSTPHAEVAAAPAQESISKIESVKPIEDKEPVVAEVPQKTGKIYKVRDRSRDEKEATPPEVVAAVPAVKEEKPKAASTSTVSATVVVSAPVPEKKNVPVAKAEPAPAPAPAKVSAPEKTPVVVASAPPKPPAPPAPAASPKMPEHELIPAVPQPKSAPVARQAAPAAAPAFPVHSEPKEIPKYEARTISNDIAEESVAEELPLENEQAPIEKKAEDKEYARHNRNRVGLKPEGIGASDAIQYEAQKPSLAAEYFRAAKYNLRTNALDAAERDIDRALELYPDNLDYLLVRGMIEEQKGNTADAALIYARVLAKDPQHSAALDSLGHVNQIMGRPDLAEESYARSLGANPANGCASANYGSMLAARGACEAAIPFLSAALERQCVKPAVLNNLSYCYFAKNDMENAQQIAYSALEKAPADQTILSNFSLIADKSEFNYEPIKVQSEIEIDPFYKLMDYQKETILESLTPVETLDFYKVAQANYKKQKILVIPYDSPRGTERWNPLPGDVDTRRVVSRIEESGMFDVVVADRSYSLAPYAEKTSDAFLNRALKKYPADIVYVGKPGRHKLEDKEISKFGGLKKSHVVEGTLPVDTLLKMVGSSEPIVEKPLYGKATTSGMTSAMLPYDDVRRMKNEALDDHARNLTNILLERFNLLRHPVRKNVVKFIKSKPKKAADTVR